MPDSLLREVRTDMAKVLVIDDDTDLCDAVRIVLELEGIDVLSANSRNAGKQAVASFKPDLVILDVMMEQPDDGFVLASDLRGSGFDKPILMLTNVGHVTGMYFDRDDDLVPVDEFYEKPISPAQLIEVVTRLLQQGGC